MNIADYIKAQLPKWPIWINFLILKLNVFGGRVYGRSYESFKRNFHNIDSEERLLSVVNFAIRNVPYYRNRYGNLEIHSVVEFQEKIAFIDKDEVMRHWKDFIADNVKLSECVIGTTGGTSGKPLKLVNSTRRYVEELVFMHTMWQTTGWNYHIRGVIRNHKLPASRTYMLNPITKEVIFDAFRISPNYVRKIVRVLQKYHVEYIQAYPSAAYQFCKLCKANAIDISFLRCFLCGSEAVTEEQYAFIVKDMKIGLFSWYGHSEKLILGGTTHGGRDLYIEPKYGYFELIGMSGNVISRKDERGEMVGTTFYNYCMPLIRYKTGDYAVLSQDISGREDVILKEVVGRWDKNLIFRRDGTTTTITALNLHGDIYEHIDGLQYVQRDIGQIEIHVIKGEGYTETVEKRIYAHVKNAMGEDSEVMICYVDRLTICSNGKFLPLISLIK